ncbi:MAG: SpoIID/LytB domain-containing protein [Candidatus Omnitrophica bacterium]|nr:SpoIID/LytB domain-containing protein [Candidatus Omnitrophota bacterium]
MKRVLCALIMAFWVCGDVGVMAGTAFVRVAILREVSHCTLTIDGRYEVIDQNTGKNLTTAIRLRPALVALKGGAIQVGDSFFDARRITVIPRSDAMMSINNRHYRGTVTIINNDDKSISVINSIELEQYIRGVLYHEVSDKWPLEAIKAQAVATRTYAVYSMQQYAGRDFDMTSDIYSQVYGGRSSERYRTNLAVSRTRGEVLTYKGKVFPAFFHANCGGLTEDAKELWGIDLPPLKGGVVSPFSVDAPHYKWRRNFRLKDIQQKLNLAGVKVGEIADIRVMERNKSERVRSLKITARDGSSLKLDGKSFRDIVGPNLLLSNKYDIVMRGWYVDFEGYGWGHGVGMCQWGAYGMAKLRNDYKKILVFYYPSSDITTFQNLD